MDTRFAHHARIGCDQPSQAKFVRRAVNPSRVLRSASPLARAPARDTASWHGGQERRAAAGVGSARAQSRRGCSGGGHARGRAPAAARLDDDARDARRASPPGSGHRRRRGAAAAAGDRRDRGAGDGDSRNAHSPARPSSCPPFAALALRGAAPAAPRPAHDRGPQPSDTSVWICCAASSVHDAAPRLQGSWTFTPRINPSTGRAEVLA